MRGARLVAAGWLAAGCIEVPSLAFRDAADAALGGPVGDAVAGGDGTLGRADAGPGRADAGPHGDAVLSDARGPDQDGRLPGPDARGPLVDASGPERDARGPDVDASGPGLDALGPELDGSGPVPDASGPARDASGPGLDAAGPNLDALGPDLDAVRPPSDAIVPPLDSIVPPLDAAPPPPDAAPPPPDLAPDLPPPPDAAPPPPDGPVVVPPPPFVQVPAPNLASRFGGAVLVVPDQNGDGFADAVVGAPGLNDEQGAVHLVDGYGGALLASTGPAQGLAGLGAALALVDLDGDGRPEVAASAPRTDAGRGMVILLSLPELELLALSQINEQANNALGTALAPARLANGTQAILAGVPGVRFSPRVYFLTLQHEGGQLGVLERTLRLNVSPDYLSFGTQVAAAPPSDAGNADDVIGTSINGLDGERRVWRVRQGSPAPTVHRYRADDEGPRYGDALANLGGQPALLAVGDPGLDPHGAVLVFPLAGGDNDADVRPLRTLRPEGQAAQFGASLTVAPLFHERPGGAPSFCAGDPGGDQIPGHVECMDAGGAIGHFEVRSDTPGTEFGRAVSAATTRDPDDTWLLAVGGPAARGPNGRSTGSLVLVHVAFRP